MSERAGVSDVETLVAMLRSENPDDYDSAYRTLCEDVPLSGGELLNAIRQEENPRALSVLLELLGSSDVPTAVTILRKALGSRQRDIALGAVLGLQRHASVEAQQALAEWRAARLKARP